MLQRVLLLSSLLILFTGSVFAQPSTQWSANANTAWYNSTDTEFAITTSEQIAGLSVLVAGGNDFSGKTINIMNDLDLAAHLWTPIGPDYTLPFSGTVDGNDHVISNLFIVIPGVDWTGLFGMCTNSTISNIRLDNVYLRAAGTAGALMGNCATNSTITDCHATGVDIVGTSFNVGGLVGSMMTNSNMLRCSSTGSVTGESQVGGLVGSPWDLTSITECWSGGTVSAQHLAGGLVGYCTIAFLPDRNNTLNNCYSRANVTVVNGRAGGLYGGADGNLIAANCYSTGTATGAELIGGFIGAVGGMNTTNSYWDMETSGLANGIGGWLGAESPQEITGKTTAEMKTTTMVDLLNGTQTSAPWTIDPSINDGYPILASMSVGIAPFAASPVELSVYPIPFNATVQLGSRADLLSYSIYSTTGNLIRSAELTGNSSSLDLRDLASGAYVLSVLTSKGIATERIIKQ
ncbi:MAG: T9SS type A sorting domain-containing protein [Flavobacteriales bacterium]|nr:T9SS type A sorting domain-containing protein [Flavobacteriales bacterium]